MFSESHATGSQRVVTNISLNPHMQSPQEMHDVVPQLLLDRCTLGVLPQEPKVFYGAVLPLSLMEFC